MAVTIQLRRGGLAGLEDEIFTEGELAFDTTNNDVYINDVGQGNNYRLSMDKDWTANSFRYATTIGTPENKSATQIMAILSGQATSAFDFNGEVVSGVGAPSDPGDAVNKAYVDHLVSAGIVWRAPVLTITNTSPPGGDATGDRYYINGVGSGAWLGYTRTITELTADGWEFWPDDGGPLEEGDAFYCEFDNKFYFVNDTSGNIVNFSDGMGAHGASHTDETDDIQNATAGQKGLMTSVYATKLDGIATGADLTSSANVAAAGAVMEADYNAHTVLRTLVDNGATTPPSPLTVSTQTVVGRLTGANIAALNGADLWTILTQTAAIDVDMNGQQITNMADPGAAQDAATQAYVLAQVAGKDTFLELNDTPGNYTGAGGKLVSVEDIATPAGLVFATADGGTWAD